MTTDFIDIVKELSHEIEEQVQAFREHIHAHPELSYEEYETMKFVASKLKEFDIPHQIEVGKTGVIGIIRASHHTEDQPCIALRADLDALPIHEENNVPYKSLFEGKMHACGHDVHTSVLLGAAFVINKLKEDLQQPVKLIFQPGEEKNPGGATLMIADGVLKNPEVKEIYALHVFPDMEVGKFGFKEGLYMASCDEIYIDVIGKGGHGATPHNCIDPIFIGSSIITQLQSIVSRKCDPKIPCVLSFGHFEALGATNVIPEKAHLKGTFRTMDEEWRAKALELIESSAKTIAEASGGKAEVTISKGYPFLTNDVELTKKQRDKAIQLVGKDKVEELPIRLTAEDFSYYSQEIPSCFFRLGVRNEAKGIVYGVHHPRFDIDPNSLSLGVQIMTLAVFK